MFLMFLSTVPNNVSSRGVTVVTLACVKQHVSVEASLEGKASPALGAVEGFVCIGPMDGLVGFQLQQLTEGLPAQFAAQGLLLLTLCTNVIRPGLGNRFGSGGVLWVYLIWVFGFQLTEKTNSLILVLLCFSHKALILI